MVPTPNSLNVRTYCSSVLEQDSSYKDAALMNRNQSVAGCRTLSLWSVDVQIITRESVHLVATFNRL
jgi:hypothetical protein